MLYLIAALLIWSSSFVAAKYAYTMLDPALMVEARLLIAALLALPFCRRHFGKIPKNKRKTLLWLVFVNYVLVLLGQFIGVKYTSAASAATIVGLEPVLMVFVGHFFFRDKAAWYHWVCGLAAFAGVAVMIAGGSEAGGGIDLRGCLLVLLSGFAFSMVFRPTQKFIAEVGAPAFSAVSFVAAAVLCLPFSLLLAESYRINWNWQGMAALLYLGVGASWLAYRLWNKGIGSVSANVSGILTALEPVFGVCMAVLLLGERISPVSGIGIFIVISATFFAVLIPKIILKNNR
ncbi:DMT family transporter [Neisseria sp. ZJ106]|uniref:DMT family transporter n=1 Tax=Neisseria lisongii TaxID=2912188 RepID=A0AAW5ALS5_9NEIS|nr:DMT family transporter [Neisseria lisongii]MCF7521191.1 DMT family transporter [Neisseria lisongii]MCF7530471.1 DMT family transporter [Neisseria lisongii]WCL71684.1 DMT family transporter [Neisseria lisongii]